MTKILRTAASRLAQGGNKYAEQRKKAQRRLRKCKKNELNDPHPQKLNYRLRLIFSIFLFSLLTFTLCTAPCAFAANGTLTKDTDGYYLIEDEKDLAAFSEGVNNGTLSSENARLTADIDLSVYTNWTAIGDETNRYAGTFDGRGHEIKGLAVNITDAAGDYLYTGLFGNVTGTIKNLAVSGSITVNCGGVDEINAGGVAGQVLGGAVENCVSRVSVTSTNTNGGGARNYLGGVVGKLNNGSAANCTSYGNVTSEMAAGADCTGNAGGVVGYNSDSTISNCVNYGAVTANGDSGDVSNAYVYAGGITAQNWGTIENCTSYSNVATTAASDNEAKTGGIAGYNGHGDGCVIKNCVVGAVSISQNGDKDKAGAILGGQGTGSTTNCAWEKGDNMPQPGIPESLNVLLHELRGLAISVKLD